jgi:hypothetical protein
VGKRTGAKSFVNPAVEPGWRQYELLRRREKAAQAAANAAAGAPGANRVPDVTPAVRVNNRAPIPIPNTRAQFLSNPSSQNTSKLLVGSSSLDSFPVASSLAAADAAKQHELRLIAQLGAHEQHSQSVFTDTLSRPTSPLELDAEHFAALLNPPGGFGNNNSNSYSNISSAAGGGVGQNSPPQSQQMPGGSIGRALLELHEQCSQLQYFAATHIVGGAASAAGAAAGAASAMASSAGTRMAQPRGSWERGSATLVPLAAASSVVLQQPATVEAAQQRYNNPLNSRLAAAKPVRPVSALAAPVRTGGAKRPTSAAVLTSKSAKTTTTAAPLVPKR